MKKYIFSSAIALTSVLVIAFFYFQNETEPTDNRLKYPIFYGMPSSSGDGENPHARKEFETRKLIDPATGEVPVGIRAKEIAFAKKLPNDLTSEKVMATWTAMGPANQGGRTRAFAMDVTNENIMLAGGVSGGLWRTTDAGASWNKVTTPNQHQSITCITQDTRAGKENIWYYGSGEGAGNSPTAPGAFYMGNGLYKSTDGGLTWSSLSSTVSGTPQGLSNQWDIIYNVVTPPIGINDVVYIATLGAIFKSIDGGTSWNKVLGIGSSTSSFAYHTSLSITSTGILYAELSSDGPDKGLWRSTDGDNWVNITPLSWPSTYNRSVFGIDPQNENVVYVLASTPGSGQSTTYFGGTEWNSLWKYRYLSGDGSGAGGEWADLSANLPIVTDELHNFATQGSYDMVVKVKPNDSNTVFIAGTNMFRSTDGFSTNSNTSLVSGYIPGTTRPFYEFTNNNYVDFHELFFLPSNPDVLFTANDNGLSKTLDCSAATVTWNSLNNGYLTTQFYTVAIDHGTNGSNEVIGGLQDIGSYYTNSSNPVDPWTMPSVGDGSFCAIPDGAPYYLISRQLGIIVKMALDVNGYPTAFRRIDPIGASDYLFIHPFTLDPTNNNIMYLPEGVNIWRNYDLSVIPLDNSFDTISTNWFKLTDTLDQAGEIITAVGASKSSPTRLYYGSSNKNVYKIDNANTGDPSATKINATFFPFGGYVNNITVDPRDPDKVIVVYSNYGVYSVFYSRDGGTSWEPVAGNLEQFVSGVGNGPSCRWVSILPLAGGKTVYLLGTSTGLYATDTLVSGGTFWRQQGTGTIGNVVIEMIDVRESDGFVAVATHGNGVYTTHITSVDDIKTTTPKRKQALSTLTAYPSPTNGITTIAFSLSNNDEVVSLVIYDQLGKKVATVLNKKMTVGKHTIQYNTSSLANGTYYYTLTTKSGRVTNRLVVNK